jgi:pyruvate,water dikinase
MQNPDNTHIKKNSEKIIYSNKISRELLPGMIKPLVWSINIPVVNSSWKQLFRVLTGSIAESIQTEKLARSFYYRCYFNMSVIGDFFEIIGISRDALEVISGIKTAPKSKSIFRPSMKIIRYLPRMTAFGFQMYFFSKRIEVYLRQKTKQYKEIDNKNLNQLNIEACFKIIDILMHIHKESSYVVIITQLLNSIYNQGFKRSVESKNLDFNSFNFAKKTKTLSEIDPRTYISKLNSIFEDLPEQTKQQIQKADYAEIINNPECKFFSKELENFIKRFGYLSDNANDFSRTTWKENLKLTIRMMLYHQTPQISQSQESKNMKNHTDKTSFLSNFLFKKAAQYQIYRGSVGFIYNFGFGLFRKLFLHVSEIMVKNNLIELKEDIFYLTYKEIKQLAKNNSKINQYRALIEKRKKEMKEYRGLILPDTIFNELPKTSFIVEKIKKDLRGVPSSRGKYSGIAKIVLGIQDYEKIKDGDVLVIPFSDPSWTPLFSKARAVISESGGILSHCSIVAREYGIPAVVSVKGALQIEDGSKVEVDGYTGKITMLKK